MYNGTLLRKMYIPTADKISLFLISAFYDHAEFRENYRRYTESIVGVIEFVGSKY